MLKRFWDKSLTFTLPSTAGGGAVGVNLAERMNPEGRS